MTESSNSPNSTMDNVNITLEAFFRARTFYKPWGPRPRDEVLTPFLKALVHQCSEDCRKSARALRSIFADLDEGITRGGPSFSGHVSKAHLSEHPALWEATKRLKRCALQNIDELRRYEAVFIAPYPGSSVWEYPGQGRIWEMTILFEKDFDTRFAVANLLFSSVIDMADNAIISVPASIYNRFGSNKINPYQRALITCIEPIIIYSYRGELQLDAKNTTTEIKNPSSSSEASNVNIILFKGNTPLFAGGFEYE